MVRIQKSLQFYINSSLHVAVSVLSLCWISSYNFNISLSFELQIALFCASVLGYNFVKYFGLAKFHYRSLTSRLKDIQMLSVLCVVGFFFGFYHLKSSTKIMLSVLSIITFLYANPIGAFQTLRQIRGLKIYVIAVVWTLVTVFIPILESEVQIELNALSLAFQRFIFILILMLPFEIRDMNFDDLKLSTVPQSIGLKKTKILGFLGILLWGFLAWKQQGLIPISSSILVMLLLSVALVKSHPKRDLNFTALWVEAVPIFWWISILILESI